MEEFLKKRRLFAQYAKNNHNNAILAVGQYMENVGHNELNFYQFLKMQRYIPSLRVDEDLNSKVQSRVNQLESEYEAGIYDPTNKNKRQKESKICKDKK